MTKILLRREALILRKQGKSYSQIRAKLGLSKSTLSKWLKRFPLTRDQINSLSGRSEIRIEKYRQTMLRKRETKLDSYYKDERKKYVPLSHKELLVAGLFLYWGEGDKTQRGSLSISNTDPTRIKFALYWMTKALKVPKKKIQVFLHLYKDMRVMSEMNYWAKMLNLPLVQFAKPYIKQSKKVDIDEKGFGHGTCGVRVFDTVLKERTLMAIKAITDSYQEKV